MISIGDVVKEIVSDDSDMISRLDNYVHNSYEAQQLFISIMKSVT